MVNLCSCFQDLLTVSDRHPGRLCKFSSVVQEGSLAFKTLRSKCRFSFVAPIHFLQKKWGEVDKISIKFILCDHVRNSHDHYVLQSIDITRKNFMLITLRASRVNKKRAFQKASDTNFNILGGAFIRQEVFRYLRVGDT